MDIANDPKHPAANPNPTVATEPDRATIDAMETPLVLEFGTSWCSHCRAAQPAITKALAAYPAFRHLKIEDGKGRLLGRSFAVKLWPTLVFLRRGQEIARLVRPQDVDAVLSACAALAAAA